MSDALHNELTALKSIIREREELRVECDRLREELATAVADIERISGERDAALQREGWPGRRQLADDVVASLGDKKRRAEAERDAAIAELERLRSALRMTHVTYCTPAYTERGLHAPECLAYEVGAALAAAGATSGEEGR